MKIPTTLNVKPVVVSENDEQVDGRLARNTDVKGRWLILAKHPNMSIYMTRRSPSSTGLACKGMS